MRISHAHARRPHSPPAERVSTLELFFDLVFVFTITQVTELAVHAHGPLDFARALMVLTTVWWMYGGYAWLTNNVGVTHPIKRMLVLTAMLGFLVMALSIPRVFAEDGLTFGCAYLLVNLIHTAVFAHAPDESSARAIWRIAPFNLGSALLILVSALLPSPWRTLVWAAALGLLVLMPFVVSVGRFAVNPAHFVERHGLVILIVLGESVVAIGVGASGAPITPALLAAAALTLALIASLWWSYFDRDDLRAEHSLREATGPARGRMALYAFGYAHLLMVAGVVLVAGGVKQYVGHLASTDPAAAGMLAAGVAIYLFGDALFRILVRISPSRLRLAAAGGALVTIPLGVGIGGVAEIVALLALMVVVLKLEYGKMMRCRILGTDPYGAAERPLVGGD